MNLSSTSAGIYELQVLSGLTKLEEIDLTGTHLPNAALEYLKTLSASGFWT